MTSADTDLNLVLTKGPALERLRGAPRHVRPTRGEAAWLLPGRRKPYWRGTLTALRCEFAP